MLKVKNLTVTFPRRDGTTFNALDNVSISIPDGQTIAIVGESGSGKTTLVRTICSLQKATSGEVIFENGKKDKVSMVFQDAVGALNPKQTIGSAIKEVLRYHKIVPKDETDAEVKRLLTLVGLPLALADSRPTALSGGQCQRACIARALALRPTLLIGDEPVSALDVSVQARILRLFSELMQEKESNLNSLLIITHDLAVVSSICDYVYILKQGRIVEEGKPGVIFSSPQHPYTKRLLAAVPSATPLSSVES